MPILPSGNNRVMENQPSLGVTDEWGIDDLRQPNGYPQPRRNGQQDNGRGEPDIHEYVFDLLEGFGYPPRRLEEFSDNFVEEKLFPGGLKEVTVTLPDRYYGTRKRLSDSDIARILEDMQSKFKCSHFKTFKKAMYNQTEGVDPTLKKAVDKDLTLKLEEQGRILFIPDVLYLYRRHSRNISNRFKKLPKEKRAEIGRDRIRMYDNARKRRGLI